MPWGRDRVLRVTGTVFYSLMSLSQAHMCEERLRDVSIFQMMLQDERRPPAHVPRALQGQSGVTGTLSSASGGSATFLFREGLFWFGFVRLWVLVWVFFCFLSLVYGRFFLFFPPWFKF